MGIIDFFKNKISYREHSTEIRVKMRCEDFCIMMANNILSRIIDDAINPLELKDEIDKSLLQIGKEFFDISGYGDEKPIFERNKLFMNSVSLREICIRSLYSRVIVSKVDIEGENFFFIDGDLYSKEKRIGNKTYPITRAFSIDRPLLDKETLFWPIRALYNFYNQINLAGEKGNVLFFKKEGFNKTLDGVSPEVIDELIRQAKETYTAFLSGKGGIVDQKDTFEFLTPNISGMAEAINFVYTEISRVLGIPQAELLGQSPTGLNSGGIIQFQSITYEKRLKDYRKRLIEPILQGLDIKYVFAGLSLEEKLGVLKDFSTYSLNLEVASGLLYQLSLKYTLELLNEDPKDIQPDRESRESSFDGDDDFSPNGKDRED